MSIYVYLYRTLNVNMVEFIVYILVYLFDMQLCIYIGTYLVKRKIMDSFKKG